MVFSWRVHDFVPREEIFFMLSLIKRNSIYSFRLMLGNGQYLVLHGGDQDLVLIFADAVLCFDEGKV